MVAAGLGLLLTYQNCGDPGSIATAAVPEQAGPNFTQPLSVSGSEPYVIPMSVGCGYVNEPCVSVTVCEPNGGDCVVVDNILVDTGSYGLRVFANQLSSLKLTQLKDDQGHSLAECQSYKDGTSDWGFVAAADVKLGQRVATAIPIQVIDSGFGTPPSDCTDLESDPSTAGYNGIMGIGVFAQDCGATCANSGNSDNRIYFNCSASSINCENSSVSVALKYQITNPATQLDSDNNGIVLQFPNIPPNGQTAVKGFLILGIGTQSNNTPGSQVQTFAVDTNGDFQSTYSNGTLPGFIDSGSNGVFFPNSKSWPNCTQMQGFYCPSDSQSFFATQIGSDGANNAAAGVSIVNADQLLAANGSAQAFNNIAGPLKGFFDWGMPFFYGRTIYVGFEKATSPLGTGPSWSY